MTEVLILGKGKPTAYSLNSIYVEPAENKGFSPKWIYKDVYYPKDNKGRFSKTVKSELQKEWLNDNKELLNKVDLILCTDANYFKTLTKNTKVETCIGQIYESTYTTSPIMYVPSVAAYSYNPNKTKEQIDFAFTKALQWTKGNYVEVGSNIIHSAKYPSTVNDIKVYLDSLLNKPRLYVDIETFSLYITKAGLGTIAFATDKHNGGAFAVDLSNDSLKIRELLVDFFKTYQGNLVFHKANFDVMILIYELFMNKDLSNHNGMMEGLDVLFRHLDDTLLITYLATNSCAGNSLRLKQLAAEYAGDWAVDVNDITKVPLQDLLVGHLPCEDSIYHRHKLYLSLIHI